jgi:hypothetical protein
MNASIRYEIDDTERIQPHVRLCHRILSEALAAGFTAVELAAPPGAGPTARAQSDGSWKPFMAFPAAVYGMLVEHLKHMAGMAPEQRDGDGTFLVQSAGRDAAVNLSARRNDQGFDELVLHFPAKPTAKAAT